MRYTIKTKGLDSLIRNLHNVEVKKEFIKASNGSSSRYQPTPEIAYYEACEHGDDISGSLHRP